MAIHPLIIIADDDIEDQQMLKDSIESCFDKISLIFASNGTQVLALLNEQLRLGRLPALIVLDHNMPLLNGTQTLQAIKADKNFNNIPVIIYSTSINPGERDSCISLGAVDYITKPTTVLQGKQTADIFLTLAGKL